MENQNMQEFENAYAHLLETHRLAVSLAENGDAFQRQAEDNLRAETSRLRQTVFDLLAENMLLRSRVPDFGVSSNFKAIERAAAVQLLEQLQRVKRVFEYDDILLLSEMLAGAPGIYCATSAFLKRVSADEQSQAVLAVFSQVSVNCDLFSAFATDVTDLFVFNSADTLIDVSKYAKMRRIVVFGIENLQTVQFTSVKQAKTVQCVSDRPYTQNGAQLVF